MLLDGKEDVVAVALVPLKEAFVMHQWAAGRFVPGSAAVLRSAGPSNQEGTAAPVVPQTSSLWMGWEVLKGWLLPVVSAEVVAMILAEVTALVVVSFEKLRW
jgi:hypothetical protein